MKSSTRQRAILPWIIAVGACCCLLPTNRIRGQNYTPEHPQVVAMVDRGVAFLTSSRGEPAGGMYALGAPLMAGYAVLKVTGDSEHPKVKAGIEVARRVSQSLANNRQMGAESKIVYEASVASILLATADAVKFRREIEAIRDWLVQIQKPHGGFGYPGNPSGDTSQVQYAMLAFWTMHKAGIQVPMDAVESTVQYLKRVQDPGGGWGYDGILGNGLVPQSLVSKSLATAGAGAIIMGGDILGFYGSRSSKELSEEGIPAAFVRTDLRDQLPAQQRRVTMSRSDTDNTIASGIRFLTAMSNDTNIPYWYFYWRYSQERYESFREIYEGKQPASPAWYNLGAIELSRLQESDGSWGGAKRSDHTPPEVSTAFAILFLIRSTQRAIGKINEGILAGGYGLPKNVAAVQRVGDRIVSDAEVSVESLLETLESHDTANMEVGLIPRNLQLSPDAKTRAAQVSRLARLLFARDWKARRIAAKLLGRSDDINRAPELIDALTDNDPEVPALAEEGLRLLSRKLTVRHLDQNPTFEQKKQAHEFWKAWYLSLRPDYVFLSR